MSCKRDQEHGYAKFKKKLTSGTLRAFFACVLLFLSSSVSVILVFQPQPFKEALSHREVVLHLSSYDRKYNSFHTKEQFKKYKLYFYGF